MSVHPNTRSRARSAALLRAHTDVTSRHTFGLGAAAVAVLSVALVFSTASSAAAAVQDRSGGITRLAEPTISQTAPPAGGAVATAMPMQEIASHRQNALEAAQDAVANARQVEQDVADAGLPLALDSAEVDTAALEADIEKLRTAETAGPLVSIVLASQAEADTPAVVERTAAVRAALTTAQEKKAAEEKEAAELAAANTVDGAKAYARDMASRQHGWGADQFSCLVSLWNKESGWNYRAYNPSGATGIPQALPGSKMASAGSNWRDDARVQIAWGLDYIARAYGTPCSAWGHSQATNWY